MATINDNNQSYLEMQGIEARDEQMAYGNFNTYEGGNDCDYTARETMLARSIYGPDRQYGVDIKVDTSNNVREGQYDGAGRSRLPYTCPVM